MYSPFEIDPAVLDAGLQRVPAGDERPAVGRAPHALDVPEVPGVADAARVPLRDDVDRRHQRGEAADRVLERVVDAERRVEDVAVLRDARVLQVVVADVGFVQHARAERVRVRDAAEPRRRLAERRRRRRVGPAERFLDVLHRSRQRERASGSSRRSGAARSRSRRSRSSSVGITCCCRYSLAEGAVAAEQRLAAGRRRNQELSVALRVQDVERHRMDVGRRQLPKDQPRRIGEELRDEPGLLLGRETRAGRS